MRSFAMRVYAGAYLAIIAVALYVLVIFILANSASAGAGPFVLIFAIFLVLFVLATAAAIFWRSAARRAWFWPLAMLPGIAFYLLNAPFLVYDLLRPANVPGFPTALVFTVAAVALLISGIAAALDARRGAPTASVSRSPWTRFALAVVVAATVGAVLASVGSGALSSSGSFAETPTRTALLNVRDAKFVGSIEATSGEALGLFITNQDAFEHAFDIDALNIHVRLPAKGTAAVVVKSNKAGALKYYCGVPGHESAGMVGELNVR
jgi:cupredoxin-like protein